MPLGSWPKLRLVGSHFYILLHMSEGNGQTKKVHSYKKKINKHV